MNKYLVIGAGVAGVSAIEAIRTKDAVGEIIQVFDDAAGYYSRPGLAYLLTGEVSEDCLFPYNKVDFDRLNVHQIKGRIKHICPPKKNVVMDNGKILFYDRLLISTGARAAEVKVPGVELDGVVKLDSLNDAHHILKYAHRRRTAVIIGGGITALELVEGFRARGLKVHYFLRGDRYWSNVLDNMESRIVEDRLSHEGVQIHYQTELGEILGKKGRVFSVVTTDGKKIDCDIVGIAIGIKPRTGIAESAGIKVSRGISVDEFLTTSDPNIFAAGDVAEVYHPDLGRGILDSLWEPARRQGYTAGLNMTGEKIPYSKGTPFNVTRLAGLTTTIIGALGGRDEDTDVVGIMRGESEVWRQIPDALVAQSNFDVNRLRILFGENHLAGAILIGDQTLSRALFHLIVDKINISQIREKLLAPRSSITDVIANFWSEMIGTDGHKGYTAIKS